MGTWYSEKRPHEAYRGGEFAFDKRYLEVAVVVGDRIRRLRHDRGVRLLDLARTVPKPGGDGYSPSHLSRLERGWAHAPLYVYLRIASALDVDPWGLFAQDEVGREPSAGELVLLRFLRHAGIPAEEALARIATPGARPVR